MWQPRTPGEAKAADDAVRFFAHLKHTKGKWAGVPFILEPWQEHEIIRPIFGTLNPDGRRQFRTAYIEVPRKNGKSEKAAGVALKCLFADGEAGGEVYGAAEDRDQASIVFNVAAQMVRDSPELSRRAKVIDSSKRILVTAGRSKGSVYRAIPADAAGSHGFNASAVIFDEIHTQRTRELWEVLTTSTGARDQPLVFGITTAGFDRESLCWDLHSRALGLLKLRYPEAYAWSSLPVAGEDEPTFFACVYAAPEDADWASIETARAANPNFGVSISQEYLETQIREAQQTPAYQNTYRRLHLNQWTGQDSRWLDMSHWERSAGPLKVRELEKALDGQVAFGGLDISSTTDLTAWVLVFPPEDPDTGEFRLLARMWMPEEGLQDRIRRDQAPYDLWAAAGLIELIPGPTIDHAAIRRQAEKDRLRFDVREAAFDRWNAGNLPNDLEDAGIPMLPFGQGFKDMSFPTKLFDRLIRERRLHHGGNPALRWMADHTAVETDSAGNLKPSKSKSTKRIDAIVAGIMALDRAWRHRPSTYEDNRLFVL